MVALQHLKIGKCSATESKTKSQALSVVPGGDFLKLTHYSAGRICFLRSFKDVSLPV